MKQQIGEAIGKGAFGKVYKALNTDTGDFCAVKQIEKSIISEKQLPSILQEIKLLQTLQHNNIVKFIESHETPKFLFFALEFIEGGSLAKIAKRYGNFAEPLLSRYICQVLRGLEYLHDKGVIHRDIKSDNILITKEGVIKLADFGSCTYSALDRKLTVVGTPFWMAPEVIQMDMNARSTACDIWSLGCTILELLTGNPPYWELGTMPAMFAMVNNPHPPLPPNISSELKNFLMACFVRDINRRPTATQLMEHPWIKMHQVDDPKKAHRVSIRAGAFDDEPQQQHDDHDDENASSDLKERVTQLEAQKKEMNYTIQKLKVHFIRAMREKKLMKEMIAQLVQERDGYMVKLGMTPPPPPSILATSNEKGQPNSKGTMDGAEILDSLSRHARSSSAPITPPIKIATTTPSPLTTGASSSTSSGQGSGSFKSTNILSSDFFQPLDDDSDSDDPSDQGYLISSFSDLHAARGASSSSSNNNKKGTIPRLTRNDGDHPEFQSNTGLNGYLSTSGSLHVFQATGDSSSGSLISSSPSSSHHSMIGGSLNINGITSGKSSISSNGGGNDSLGRKPVLTREPSHKSQLNQVMQQQQIIKERRNSLSGKESILNMSGSISLSSSGSVPRKSSQPMLPGGSLSNSSERSLTSSGNLEDGENAQTVPPVESIVVNVQPPRIGDECKVKCGDGWYDAVVELVSGSTFVVTIKPFNIKQEVSQSDVTLAPLQFPVSTKKKGKFSIFSSGKSSGKT
ncbi:hypothetical protein SAMD00019534_126050 [Acytostelium subglobosum LB1]|uniref:hypothetical protein n=1 Tax=Acytostelium subglobosum LB1 TaxID=1410327 RepID=UPI0006450CA8|nr:hypothetical protein SAMD00019534_126050 [Acytostelium subglobosum LB1]GAM29429.1 hypothetical protein SAMD00019534_126050 [Acytostelium subglobosum LB1]|eukprot:XP_012747620.1 hypothetical protein SAMD00019534_126050 [Acytostelium subglobosum LB1]